MVASIHFARYAKHDSVNIESDSARTILVSVAVGTGCSAAVNGRV